MLNEQLPTDTLIGLVQTEMQVQQNITADDLISPDFI